MHLKFVDIEDRFDPWGNISRLQCGWHGYSAGSYCDDVYPSFAAVVQHLEESHDLSFTTANNLTEQERQAVLEEVGRRFFSNYVFWRGLDLLVLVRVRSEEVEMYEWKLEAHYKGELDEDS